MSFEEHDTEDLQPRTAPCRSSSFQPCIAPSVPEVSLIFNSGSSVNTGTSATAARGLHHETSATERRNVKSVSNAGYHEVLKYGTYPSSHHEGNKLPHCSSHKPDEILGAVKLDNINCPSTAVLRDNRNVESEVITNSKRTFLPRTFSNRCNSFDKNIDGTQQNYCAHDSSVTNRKPDRLAYQQNGSQNSHESKKSMSLKNNQNNDGDRSVWNENNGYRNFYGSAYHSKPGVEKCRMEKSYYKRYQKKNYPQRKFPSDTENEGRSSLCCHKEASSPLNYAHRQMTCVSPDPSCIPEERTAVDYLRSRQDSVANDQTSVVIPLSPSTLFSREQEKDRDTKTSSDPVFRHKNDFNSLFLADQPTNRNLETRIDATNHIQSVNFRDTSEGVDTFKVQSANMKEAGSHDDSSMFDLYNLVRSQNEQLKHLQTQVDRLLLMRDRNSTMSTTACCCPPFTCAGIQSAKQNITVVNASTQTMVTDSRCDIAVNTDSRPVVSVAVMTSFADTADSKQSQKMERMTRLSTDCLCCPERAPENSDETVCFNSIDLPAVQEHAPSPMSSIHVDMHDYEDDDDDDDGDVATEIAQPFPCSKEGHIQQKKNEEVNRIGWTFYNNVVGQVNKLLKDLPQDSEECNRCDAEQENQKLRECQEDVKNATMDQLRKMGISFHNSCGNGAPAEVGREQQYDSVHLPRLGVMPITSESSESDTSIHINALALKYLKNDDRGKGADRMQDLTFYNVAMKTTNLSLGTLKYLERYHLLPSEGEASGGVAQIKNDIRFGHEPEKGGVRQTGRGIGVGGEAKVKIPYHQPASSTDKILDITALKKQPKLL